MPNKLTEEEVFNAIKVERSYQGIKWGDEKEQSVPGFLLIMRKELQEAEDGWIKDCQGRNSCLNEILQVVATGFACLERYGVQGNPTPTNDIIEK